MKYSTIAVNPPAATINNTFINIFDLEILPKNNHKKNNVLRLIIIANQVAMIISIIPNNERKKGIKHSIVVNTEAFEDGWNTVDVPEWEMSGSYIIAHTFNVSYAAALDETGDGSHSHFSYKLGNGDTAPWQNDIGFEGSWGTRANISFESPNVTYNVYRDEVAIASGLGSSSYSDDSVVNDILYTYNIDGLIFLQLNINN